MAVKARKQSVKRVRRIERIIHVIRMISLVFRNSSNLLSSEYGEAEVEEENAEATSKRIVNCPHARSSSNISVNMPMTR